MANEGGGRDDEEDLEEERENESFMLLNAGEAREFLEVYFERKTRSLRGIYTKYWAGTAQFLFDIQYPIWAGMLIHTQYPICDSE